MASAAALRYSSAFSQSGLLRRGQHTRRLNKVIPRVAASDTPLQSLDDASSRPPPAWVRSTNRQDMPSLETVATPHNLLLFNGRLAMMGLTAGVVGELLTNKSLGALFISAEPRVLFMTALLTLASAIPFLNGEKEGDEVFGPFNPEAEILNGKVAIVGLLALLVIEAMKGSALF